MKTQKPRAIRALMLFAAILTAAFSQTALAQQDGDIWVEDSQSHAVEQNTPAQQPAAPAQYQQPQQPVQQTQYAQPQYAAQQYGPGGRQIVGYRSRPRIGLMVSGLVMFGVSYGLAAAVGAGAEDGRFFIPVIGPLLAMDDNAGGRVLGTMWGLIQGVGLTMAILGIALRRQVPIYADAEPLERGVALLPYFAPEAGGGAGGGLTLSGAF